MTPRVATIGAGIGGLHLAHCLRARAIECTVFEALQRPGGAIHTIEVDGHVLELGPQRTRLSSTIRRLIEDLGLQDDVVTAPADLPLFVYRSGRLRRAPLSLSGLFHTDLLRGRDKLRVLLEPFTAGEKDGETVAAFFTRRFGRAAYEDLLGPLFGGLYASDPADMLVRHALAPTLRELGADGSAVMTLARRRFRTGSSAPPCSFRHGLRTLAEALHARVADRVRLGAAAVSIDRAGTRWRVATEHDEDLYDHVVLTTPAAIAARLLADCAPDAAGRLERLRYNPLAIVHMHSAVELEGLGFQTSLGESLETRGVTFNHALFGDGRDGVYTAFLGGARNPALSDEPDAAIGGIARREFRTVTGGDARILAVTRTRMPSWDRTWTALEGLRLPDGIHLCANYESRVGLPGRLARAEALAATLGRITEAG